MLLLDDLAGSVALVLLIGCVNIAGLLAARGVVRRAEFATRGALGASRRRLVQQLLTEGLVLSTIGGVLGVAAAAFLLDLFLAVLPAAASTTRLSVVMGREPTVNLGVAAFGIGLAVLSSLLSSVVPALRLSRRQPISAMAASSRIPGSTLSRRGSRLLVALEISMTFVVLVAAALMLRSLFRLTSVELGFDPSRFQTIEVVPVVPDPAARLQFYSRLVQVLRDRSDVQAVGAVDHVPFGDVLADADDGRPDLSVHVPVSSARALSRSRGLVATQRVLPGYFEALGLSVVQGRSFDDVDVRDGGVAIVNEAAARLWFAGAAVGQDVPSFGTVIGVVRNARCRGPSLEIEPTLYVPAKVSNLWSPAESELTIIVRPKTGATLPMSELAHVAESLGVPVAAARVRAGSEWYGNSLEEPRQRAALLVTLGSLGLAIALVGVFSTTAYAVARRTREIGLRMAFGASPGQVVRGTVAEMAYAVGIGLAVGLTGALLGARVIASFLFEIEPTDPIALAATAVAVAAMALLAAWIPARRAAQVDPCAALRAD